MTSFFVDLNPNHVPWNSCNNFNDKRKILFKIIHVNFQSIVNKVNEAELLVETEQPCILCVSEHWCSVDSIQSISLTNYKLASSFVRELHIHGGVMIFVRDGFNFGNVDYIDKQSMEMHIEVCSIVFTVSNIKYFLLNVYRPPSGCIHAFVNSLSFILKSVYDKYNYVIICGDFNIDYLSDSLERKLLLDLIDSFNLFCQNNKPTRIFTNKTGVTSVSKIDYFLTNFNQQFYTEKVVNYNIGDHLGSEVTFSIGIENELELPNRFVSRRDVSKENLRQLNLYLKSERFLDMYECTDDIDTVFYSFASSFSYAIDLYCPKKNIKLNNKPKKSWVTREVVEMGNCLRDMFWLLRSVNFSNIFLVEQYRWMKKQHKLSIRSTKKAYYSRLIECKDMVNKQKTVWNLVSRKTGGGKDVRISEIDCNGEMIADKRKVANAFVSYFATAAENTANSHFVNRVSHECTKNLSNNNSMFFRHINESDIKKIINGLKNTNAVGVDCISTVIIKSCRDNISGHLAYLINKSVNLGQFPGELKIGKIIPLFKAGDHRVVSNYRPITILNVLSKVVERAIYDQVLNFVEKYKILTNSQYGFRPGRSTEGAACDFFEYVYTHLDNHRYVGALFFDLSKAFDCLDVAFAAQKMESVGIRGNVLKWIKSYLQARRVCVAIEGESTAPIEMNLGVPQGSILGPLIFILFINDITEYVRAEKIVLFADDTSVVLQANTTEELQIKLNCVAERFSQWCWKNKLIANPQKTVLMNFFNRRPILSPFNVNFGNCSLNFCKVTKFLGTYIDGDMSWRSHLNYVARKVNRGFYAILQLKSSLDIRNLLNVYYALIHSVLSYTIVLWGNATNWERIFVLQKRVVRLIFDLKTTDSCRPYFEKYRILTLPSLYIYSCIVYVKKSLSIHGTVSQGHHYPTRNGGILKIEKHNTALFEKSPTYIGKKLYNHLPSNIKNVNGLNNFKLKLKSYLALKCCYSVRDFLS